MGCQEMPRAPVKSGQRLQRLDGWEWEGAALESQRKGSLGSDGPCGSHPSFLAASSREGSE